MWPFEEALLSAREEGYAFTGDMQRMFHELVELYQEHYYGFPKKEGDVFLPERASRHIKLALSALSKTRNRPKTPLEALKATESSVYGPREIDEIREVLSSAGNEHRPGEVGSGAGEPPPASEGMDHTPEDDQRSDQEAPSSETANPGGKRPPPNVPTSSPVRGTTAPPTGKAADGNGKGAQQSRGRTETEEANRAGPVESNATAQETGPTPSPGKQPDQGARTGRTPAAPKSPPGAPKAPPAVASPTLKALGDKVEALAGRLARLEKVPPPPPAGSNPGLDARIARLEQALAQAAQLGKQNDAMRTELASLRSQVVQLERGLKEAVSSQQEVKGRTDPQTGRELKALKASVEALESEQLELQQRITDIEAWLETMKAVLASLTNQLTALEKVVGTSEPTPAPPKKLLDLLTRKKS